MKISLVQTLFILSLCAVGPASLLAQGTIHFTAPFGFTAGDKSFAAGEYRVQPVLPQVLAVRSVGQGPSLLIMTHAAQNGSQGKAAVTFNRYGDRYFLSRMSDSIHGWELAKSPAEKELIAKKASPTVVVAVSRSQ